MYFFVFRLRAVRPAAGNRPARNWQPHGPQLATVQPAIGNRMARSWKTGF